MSQSKNGFVLDASESYDLDYPKSSPNSTESLTFKWSCVQISPDFGASCSEFTYTNAPVIKLLSLANQEIYANERMATYNFTVTVYSIVTHQSAPAFTIVTLLTNPTPMISTNSKTTIRINPQDKLVLNASITSSQPLVYITWSCGNINFENITSSATSLVGGYGLTLFPLIIAPEQLQVGISYTFQLAASYSNLNSNSNSMDYGYFTIIVDTNSPPNGGLLIVSPISGIALNTVSFLFF